MANLMRNERAFNGPDGATPSRAQLTAFLWSLERYSSPWMMGWWDMVMTEWPYVKLKEFTRYEWAFTPRSWMMPEFENLFPRVPDPPWRRYQRSPLQEMLDAHAKAFRENYCEGLAPGTAAWWKRYKSTKNWMRENGWLRSDPVRVMADTLVALHNLKLWQPPDDQAPH